jgi:hypothetical protein
MNRSSWTLVETERHSSHWYRQRLLSGLSKIGFDRLLKDIDDAYEGRHTDRRFVEELEKKESR